MEVPTLVDDDRCLVALTPLMGEKLCASEVLLFPFLAGLNVEMESSSSGIADEDCEEEERDGVMSLSIVSSGIESVMMSINAPIGLVFFPL